MTPVPDWSVEFSNSAPVRSVASSVSYNTCSSYGGYYVDGTCYYSHQYYDAHATAATVTTTTATATVTDEEEWFYFL